MSYLSCIPAAEHRGLLARELSRDHITTPEGLTGRQRCSTNPTMKIDRRAANRRRRRGHQGET
uniref:Uncharacterized protein n=1 Tax=Anopheles albimanus TaxID=7167 RepID=A0A182FUR1_ANOAL